VAVVDLFHLLLFRRCFCHLNAWIFEYLAEVLVLFLGTKSGCITVVPFATRSSRGSQTHEKKYVSSVLVLVRVLRRGCLSVHTHSG
jgi:hypothetical protein